VILQNNVEDSFLDSSILSNVPCEEVFLSIRFTGLEYLATHAPAMTAALTLVL